MQPNDIPVPGLLWGDYPERRPQPIGASERFSALLRDLGARCADAAGRVPHLRSARDARWLTRVHSAQAELALLDRATAHAQVRAMLLRDGLAPQALAQALALVSIEAQRELGWQPFETQWIAARAVLEGQLAEMATGEGKTLAVGLAAAVAGLAGMPVHVVTANDYLVVRDAERLAPLYGALRLHVGRVVQADDAAARTAAYGCDITYVTAKELVFDYLRDSLVRPPAERSEPARLRGLCMAIVDEADAILIDEARVPLILSQAMVGTEAQDHAHESLRFAATLAGGVDYQLDAAAMQATLSDLGRKRLQRAAVSLAGASVSPAWRNRLHREHAVCTALAALHLYQRDRHYLLRDGTVQLIDETTGRVAEGRVWSQGLQQLVECKEQCTPSAALATLAQITYQRFFSRYLRLGGMSGTLRDARAELMQTYGTAVRRVPLRRPCRRRTGALRILPDHAALWPAVAERAAELHALGRPVLIATDSIAEAEALAACLLQLGLPHALLHARNDSDEAAVIGRAGERGAITVTTNMAGRGTDIELGDGVNALGGLHVICCQFNSARRIDRQLAGRAARQGDAGSVETLLSLQTALLARAVPTALHPTVLALPSWLARTLAHTLQRAEERCQRVQRRRLIEHDERSERQLGFGALFE
jgi:preprotein translocase subunit SecA